MFMPSNATSSKMLRSVSSIVDNTFHRGYERPSLRNSTEAVGIEVAESTSPTSNRAASTEGEVEEEEVCTNTMANTTATAATATTGSTPAKIRAPLFPWGPSPREPISPSRAVWAAVHASPTTSSTDREAMLVSMLERLLTVNEALQQEVAELRQQLATPRRASSVGTAKKRRSGEDRGRGGTTTPLYQRPSRGRSARPPPALDAARGPVSARGPSAAAAARRPRVDLRHPPATATGVAADRRVPPSRASARALSKGAPSGKQREKTNMSAPTRTDPVTLAPSSTPRGARDSMDSCASLNTHEFCRQGSIPSQLKSVRHQLELLL